MIVEVRNSALVKVFKKGLMEGELRKDQDVVSEDVGKKFSRKRNRKCKGYYVAKNKYVNKKESLCGWKMKNEMRKMKPTRED